MKLFMVMIPKVMVIKIFFPIMMGLGRLSTVDLNVLVRLSTVDLNGLGRLSTMDLNDKV